LKEGTWQELAVFREGTWHNKMAALGVEAPWQEQMLLRNLSSRGARRNTFPYVDLALPSNSNLLGLCIGTGMLFHTGLRLYYGGPGALFMSYCIVATIVYAVLV
jgi:hypothetical protein